MFYVFNHVLLLFITEVKNSGFGLDNKLNHVLNGVFIFIEGQPHIYFISKRGQMYCMQIDSCIFKFLKVALNKW